MSAFCLLLRGRIAALRDNVLLNGMSQNNVPRAAATSPADARKLSFSSPRRLPWRVHGSAG